MGDSRVRIDRRFIAKWRTACLSRVADLLLNAQGERLRRCKNCGKLFLAVKRQEYCTLRCSQTTRTRLSRDKAKVLGMIERDPGIDYSDLLRRFRHSARLKKALEILIQEGRIRRERKDGRTYYFPLNR